ncbi:TonB-dependent receptor [Helicobacter muridarum]|nr:TonB-dependent receptor [Helicobacter muridarum]
MTSNKDEIQTSYKIEKIVTTAKGTEQLAKDAPASITTITQKDIESKPHKDLAEIVAGIPGVDIGQSMGRGGNVDISIRGMPSNYTLILIDGKRQSVGGSINTFNNGYSQADNNFFPPLNAIERIEVIRGPLSTLYGSDAIGGVINIITKKRIDKFAINVNLETVQNEHRYFGSNYIANIFTTIPIIKNTLGLQLRGRYFYHEPSSITFSGPILTETGDNKNNMTGNNGGKFTLGQIVKGEPDGGIGNPTENDNFDLGARLLWNPDSNNNLYFDAQFARQGFDNSMEQWGPHTSVARKYILMRNNLLLAHNGNYNGWNIQNSLQINQSFNNSRFNSLAKPPTNRDILGRDFIAESKIFTDLPFDNSLSVGVTYWYSFMQDLIGNPSTFAQHNIAIFAEDEWEIFDDFRLTLAIREDYYSRFGFNTSPKVYLVWNILQDWLTIKGGITSGYKAPYLNELVDGPIGLGNQGNRVTVGNPNLKPEISLSAEASILSDNDYLEIGGTYFYTQFYNKIANMNFRATDPECQKAYGQLCALRSNIDRAFIQGIEFFAGMKPILGISFDISYTYIYSKQLTGAMKGYPLENTLSHLFYSKLSWDYKNLNLYLRAEAQGKRFRGLNPNRFPIRNQILGNYYKPFFLVHIGGSYKISRNFKVNFAIYNLFDVNFIDFVHTDFYSKASSKSMQPFFFNRYNVIQEGRRYAISLSMDF